MRLLYNTVKHTMQQQEGVILHCYITARRCEIAMLSTMLCNTLKVPL